MYSITVLKSLPILVLLSVFRTALYGTELDTLWTRTVGNTGSDGYFDIVMLDDQDFMVSGRTVSEQNEAVPWLSKYNSEGELIWTNTYQHGTAYNDIERATDNNLLATGYTSLSTTGGGSDGWIGLFDSNGNLIIDASIGGNNPDEFNSILTTDSGEYITAGKTNSNTNGSTDGWIVKYQSDLSVDWEHRFGGTRGETINKLIIAGNGNYLAIGTQGSPETGNPNGWLLKFDSEGNIVWEMNYGGDINALLFEQGIRLPDNTYLIAGRIGSNSRNVYVTKVDSNGNELWSQEYEAAGSELSGIHYLEECGYLITGETQDLDGLIIRTNIDGVELWSQTIGGVNTEYFSESTKTPDGGCLIAGSTEAPDTGNRDARLLRYRAESPIISSIVPSNHEIELTGSTQLALTDRFTIYRSVDDYLYTLITEIETENMQFNFSDSNVQNGVRYYYKITSSVIDFPESSYSEVWSAIPNAAPVITPIGLQTMLEDTPHQVPITFSDADSDSVTITVLSNYGVNCEINESECIVITPLSEWNGESEVTLIASDYSMQDSLNFNVIVQPVNDQPYNETLNVVAYVNTITGIVLSGIPGPANELDQNLTFIITSLPSSGYIKESINSEPINATELPLILLGDSIFFYCDENIYQTSFEYQIQDDGGAINGGIDLSEPIVISIDLLIPELFSIQTLSPVWGGVSKLDNNSMYTASAGNDGLYRFTSEGSLLYSITVLGQHEAPPTISQNHHVYVSSTNGYLYSFNASGFNNSGWPNLVGERIHASPAVDQAGNLYLATSDGILKCISSGGQLLWGYNVGASVYASPAISESGVLYTVNENGRVYAFDLNNINPELVQYSWIYELGEGVTSSPALDGSGYIYFTTLAGKLVKLSDNGSTASIDWEYTTTDSIESSPVIDPNYNIYFGCNDGNIYAVDQDGNLVWNTPTGGAVKSTAALAAYGMDNDRLYIGSDDGNLWSFSLGNGSPVWKYNANSPVRGPILSDGSVYFGTIDGRIIAIDDTEAIPLTDFAEVAQPAEDAPVWPTFQGNNTRTGMLGSGTPVNPHRYPIPTTYNLHPNYPNPFNPSTTIKYEIPAALNVRLTVYDIRGAEVTTLVNESQPPGWYQLVWDGRDETGNFVGTGVYLVRVQAGHFTQTRKMVLLK